MKGLGCSEPLAMAVEEENWKNGDVFGKKEGSIDFVHMHRCVCALKNEKKWITMVAGCKKIKN